jgi:type IV secretion system protein VirB6
MMHKREKAIKAVMIRAMIKVKKAKVVVMKNKILLILLSVLLLAACTGEKPCIDADDFGLPKISINSRGDNSGLGLCPEASDSTFACGTPGSEIVPWSAANLSLNGQRLAIKVRNGANSQWSAWFSNTSSPSDNTVIPLVKNASACKLDTTDPICTGGEECKIKAADNMYISANNCLFNQGVGLYMLITPPNQNPNANLSLLTTPPTKFFTWHMGAQLPFIDDYNVPNTDSNNQSNYKAGGYNEVPSANGNPNTSGDLYFKILDSYYGDNSGQYEVIVLSGASDPNPGPVSRVVGYVKGAFDAASEKMFTHLAQNIAPDIQVVLTLYIIFAGISFAFGMSAMTQKELFVHVTKLSLVIALISPHSWEFFNSTFLNLFRQGVDEICCFVASGISGTVCDGTHGAASTLNFFDGFFTTFTSYESQMKILSLLVAGQSGQTAGAVVGGGITAIISFIVIEITILVFMIMVVEAVLFYLLAYIAMSLLICLFPIFLIFILFKITTFLFESWLKQAVSYSIQPIMVIASISLTAQIILAEFHKLLGFKICWQGLPLLFNTPLFKFWSPIPLDTTSPGKAKQLIPIPEPIFGFVPSQVDPNYKIYSVVCRNDSSLTNAGVNQACSGPNDNVCMPYACYDYRYPDAPYLTPGVVGGPANDQARIDKLKSGYFVELSDVFIFFIIVFLMYQFNKVASKLGKALAGVSGGADVSGAAGGAMSALGSIASAPFSAADHVLTQQSSGYRKLRASVQNVKNTVGDGLLAVSDAAKKAKNLVQDTAMYASTSVIADISGDNLKKDGFKPIKDYTAREAEKKGLDIDGNRLSNEAISKSTRASYSVKGERMIESFQDSIGSKVDALKALQSSMMDNALHDATGGIFGESLSEKGLNRH